MRVEDPITRHGKFWLPRDPKRTIPGILTIADGGTVALELLVGDESSWFEPGSSPKAPRILGLLENDLTVTLDGCHYQRWGFFGLRRDKLYVGMAILGLQFEENEDVSLIEFEFSIEGLAEWLQIRSIVVDYNFVERVSRLDHTIPGDVTVALSSGFVLTFCFGANYLGNTLTRAEIVQTVAIRLTADTARPIDEFRMIAHRLTNFLRLALDTHVSITSARIKPPEAAGATTAVDRHRWTADVYFRSLPFSTDVPVIRHHDALFDYNRIQENLQERLNRWLDTYEVTHSIFSSYFSATQSNLRFIEERFLMMLRGLEGYHRATSTDVSVQVGCGAALA